MKGKGFADILESLQASDKSKLLAKVPQWADVIDRLVIPGHLSLEQCSSSATAAIKSSLVPEGVRLADLTGGLGVDCAAFSARCSEVLYNERSADILEAVKKNYGVLGLGNVRFSGEDIRPGNLDFARAFRPDWIYLDPARRSSEGRKVFRLGDCSPDLTAILDELYSICPDILVKISPMADIRELEREIRGLREVRIVGSKGECKELLCILKKGYDGPVHISTEEFRFTAEEEKASTPSFISGIPTPGEILFEPSAILSKAGCYRLVCSRFKLEQLGPDAHLFTGKTFPSEGKVFRIINVFPLGNEGIRQAASSFPEAGVSARGLKMTSDELRRKLKCSPSAEFHIFGVSSAVGKLLICCRKMS